MNANPLRRRHSLLALRAVPAAIGLTAVCARPADAQNYGSTPLGGRSGAMGGASVAAGHDSAAALLNPANLSLIHKDTLSLSANVYGFTGATSEDFYQLTDATRAALGDAESARLSLDASTLDIYPSALGYYTRFGEDGRFVTAMSFFDVARANYSFTGEPQLRFDDGAFRATSYTLHQQDAYYFGPSFAMAVSDAFAFGVSAFTVYQPLVSSKASKALRTAANNTTFFGSESEQFLTGSSTDLQFVAGARYALGDFSVGAAFGAPTIHMTGEFDEQSRLSTTEPGGVNAQPSRIRMERFTGDLSITQPMRASLGLSYGRPRSWSIALDGHVYFGSSSAVEFSGDRRVDEIEQFGVAAAGSVGETRQRSSATTINAALGGEIFLNDTSALRFGTFLDNSTNEIPGAPGFEDYGTIRENRLGATAGYGLDLGSVQSDFGVMAYLGSGDIVSQTLFDEELFKAKFGSYGVLFYVAGSMDIEKTRKQFADKLGPGAGSVADAAADPGALLDFGTVRPLGLAELDPGLAAYAGRPDLDPLTSQPIEVRNIQNPKYDRFFERGAKLRG